MDIVKIVEQTLHKLGVSRKYNGYWTVIAAMKLLMEDECRLTAVTKEIYMRIAAEGHQSWKAVERNIRTVAQQAWINNSNYLQEIASYTMTEAPGVGDFLSILFEYADSVANSENTALPTRYENRIAAQSLWQ